MDSSQSSIPSPSPNALPPGFITIDQVQSLPNGRILFGQTKNVKPVNVIGFLTDFQPPRQTNGSDCKCTMTIIDSSVSGRHGIKVNIFRPKKEMMPQVLGAGDVILIRKVKPQMRDGLVALLSTSTSEFHVMPASNIPTVPGSPENLWQSYSLSKCMRPTVAETAYIIQANGNAEELDLPSAMMFEEKSRRAVTVKDKFSLLKDVEADRFYDILGEVIQVHENYDRVTLYLSDYTANSRFYDHIRGDFEALNGRDGDEHNYLKSRKKAVENPWPGPDGKMSIQLTLWDGHATFVREQVKVKTWVLLRNVQVKYGKSGGYLEGFLRGDQRGFDGKIQVEIMKQSEERDENDSRWVEAVGRKLEWEKKAEQQKRKALDEAAGLKRKREDGTSKGNAKERRKEKRATAEGKAAAGKSKVAEKLDLNQNIRSSHPEETEVLLSEILKARRVLRQAESGRMDVSPFHVCNYKANVRIVDYFPPNIEDFAVGRRASEFDILPNYSGGEDTDPEENMLAYRSGKGFPKKTWEWRFAVQVVDAKDRASTERLWLIVGNKDAQMLLDMDAANLRKDADLLRDLKEQLCVLWGDLEEQKSALQQADTPRSNVTPSKKPTSSPLSTRKPGDQPPTDSDDENENERRQPLSGNANICERDTNASTKPSPSDEGKQQLSVGLQIKNKAFTCCIKQYGVKVKERDSSLANAGDGKRWERRFGLFGTQIL